MHAKALRRNAESGLNPISKSVIVQGQELSPPRQALCKRQALDLDVPVQVRGVEPQPRMHTLPINAGKRYVRPVQIAQNLTIRFTPT